MQQKPVTDQEELCRLILENVSIRDDNYKEQLKDLLLQPIVVTKMPLVDPSAEAINGGKTKLWEPNCTDQEKAILKEVFQKLFQD